MDIYEIANLMTCFVEAYMSFILFETFLKRRSVLNKYVYWISVLIFAIFIAVSNNLFGNAILNAFVNIALAFFVSFLYMGTVKMRIISAILQFMVGDTAEMLVLLLLSVVFNKHVTSIVENGQLRLLGIVLSKALELSGAMYINYRAKKDFEMLNTNYWFIFTAMFTFTTVIMLIFYSILMSTESKYISDMIMICTAGLCVITVFIIFVYGRTLKQQMEMSKQQLLQMQMKNKLDHYNAMIMSQNQIKGMRHDLKNHLISISAKLNREEYSECLDYVKTMLNDVETSKKSEIDTGNTVLDAILSSKKSEAEKKQISFNIKLTIPEKLPISEDDICIIFGNALDNAIEACEKVKDDPYINVLISYKNNTLTCRIENSCIGKYTGITTKKDIKNHGIGRLNIEKAISDCNGISDIVQKDNKYIFSFMITCTGE